MEPDGDLRFDPKKAFGGVLFPRFVTHIWAAGSITQQLFLQSLAGLKGGGESFPHIASLQYKAVRNANPRASYWRASVDDPTVP